MLKQEAPLACCMLGGLLQKANKAGNMLEKNWSVMTSSKLHDVSRAFSDLVI